MKKYCLTMERTQRFCIEFESMDDVSAEEIAKEKFAATQPEDFDVGDDERDWALADEDGRVIIDWGL